MGPNFRRTDVFRRRKIRDMCTETRLSEDRGRMIICQLRVASGEPKRRAPWCWISSLQNSETTHFCCLNDQLHDILSWQSCKLGRELYLLSAVSSMKLRTKCEVYTNPTCLQYFHNSCILIFLLWLTSFYFNFIRLLFVFIVYCFKALLEINNNLKECFIVTGSLISGTPFQFAVMVLFISQTL